MTSIPMRIREISRTARRLLLAASVLMALAAASLRPVSADDAELLAALRSGGHVGLMRHAQAPGSDDPPNFQLRECSTQRNLSSEGRAQAARIGEQLRAAGLANVAVFSSQWCRCLDTARLLGLGDVEELPSLNSLVSYPRQRDEMTRATREWLQRRDLARPTLLVTHQVNISALVGEYPDEGDIVVVRRLPNRQLQVIGTLRLD